MIYNATEVTHTGERKCVKDPCDPKVQLAAICGRIHLLVLEYGE
jgi:hypothetical protein